MSEHAVVTGGASGIGAAVVARLLERGVRVTVLDLADPEEDGERLRHASLDVTDTDAVETAMAEARAAFGPVTRLVTSHGIRGAYVPALDLDAAQLKRVLDVHVVGTLLVASAMARQVRDAGLDGSVVTISSTTAYGGWANQADYGVAKAAVSQLTQNLAIEWAPMGIRVNSVAPGHTLTPMVQQMIDQGYDVSATQARTPLGRLATPDEMAGAIEHLLMDATFTTGVCVPVDGGWTSVGK
jgi:NAD(P)-dependent dehydrogenase (short-subunit alcohol dehydrogenase family)